MKNRLSLLLLVALLPAVPARGLERTLSDSLRKAIESAETFELLSLDPDRELMRSASDERFRGWRVLGKTAIKKAAERKRLVGALEKGIRVHDGRMAKCFNPRHGIHAASRDGKAFDFVICFECYRIELYDEKPESTTFTTSRTAQRLFDEKLQQAGVPLPKSSRD